MGMFQWTEKPASVLGTGDFTLKFGQFALGGIGTATFGAIALHALLSLGARAPVRH
jgi:putative pyrimidine permease RutG